MFISIVILILTMSLIKSLRNVWFILHIIITSGIMFAIENNHQMELFTTKILAIFIAVHIIIINLITFFVYLYDKEAAKQGKWRIPERTLHAFAIIGGSPAAYLSRKFLRHKTIKKSFIKMFWISIILQAMVLVWIFFFIGMMR